MYSLRPNRSKEEIGMSIAATTASILLAALSAFAAVRKLTHRPEVVQAYALAGVPEDWLNYLAITLLAGAAGLVVGIAWTPIGIAASVALLSYFIVAIAFHIRAGDAEHLPTPVGMAGLTAAALALRVASL
jgi:hypothetical protein